MRNFSSITASLAEVIKKNVGFRWEKEQEDAFNMLKSKLISTLILVFPNFDKIFKIDCDASSMGIEAFLM